MDSAYWTALSMVMLGSWVLAASWAAHRPADTAPGRSGDLGCGHAGDRSTRWHPDTVRLAHVEIQAVRVQRLPVPLMPGGPPITAMYRTQAEPAVQTTDAGRFLNRLSGLVILAWISGLRVGVWLQAHVPIKVKAHGRPAMSLVRYGTEQLCHALRWNLPA